jgi:hypothetical protein
MHLLRRDKNGLYQAQAQWYFCVSECVVYASLVAFLGLAFRLFMSGTTLLLSITATRCLQKQGEKVRKELRNFPMIFLAPGASRGPIGGRKTVPLPMCFSSWFL